MATGTYYLDPFVQYFDNSGNVLSGGFLYFYAAGTSTPLDTFTDVNLTPGQENTNPIELDSAGRASTAIFLSAASYKVVLKTSALATIATRDNLQAVPTLALDLDVDGTAGEALTANDAVYLSSGAGGETAGRWYKTDADSADKSVNPVGVGFVLVDAASGGSVTVRKGGALSGFAGLTAGSTYYIGSTAGAITATAPTLSRRVGVASSTTVLLLDIEPVPLAIYSGTADGRLTLETGVAVSTSDQTAKTTLYYTPHQGNRIALYTGSTWQTLTFAEISIAVPATTSTLYDVFVYNNAGTLALELLAWTNDTTRATALTLQDGVYVKTGATTRRYVGSMRTTGVSGQTEDSLAKRYVWNHRNRVKKLLRVTETTDTWTYTTASWRQANNAATNQVDVVVGIAGVAVDLAVHAAVANTTGAGVAQRVGIGEDSASAPASGVIFAPVNVNSSSVTLIPIGAYLQKYPAVGRHYYTWIEYGATGAAWYGDGGDPTQQNQGIVGSYEG